MWNCRQESDFYLILDPWITLIRFDKSRAWLSSEWIRAAELSHNFLDTGGNNLIDWATGPLTINTVQMTLSYSRTANGYDINKISGFTRVDCIIDIQGNLFKLMGVHTRGFIIHDYLFFIAAVCIYLSILTTHILQDSFTDTEAIPTCQWSYPEWYG